MPDLAIADGYTDLPAGKIASVVTYLEMRRPAPPPLPQALPAGLEFRRVDHPEPDWYRRLFRAIGEEWLWFSRLQAGDEQLAAILCDPAVEVFAVSERGVDRGSWNSTGAACPTSRSPSSV